MPTSQEFPIIVRLGGREAVFELLRDAGYLKTEKALEMWVRRGRISGDAKDRLMALAEQRGLPYSVRDFQLAPTAEAA